MIVHAKNRAKIQAMIDSSTAFANPFTFELLVLKCMRRPVGFHQIFKTEGQFKKEGTVTQVFYIEKTADSIHILDYYDAVHTRDGFATLDTLNKKSIEHA